MQFSSELNAGRHRLDGAQQMEDDFAVDRGWKMELALRVRRGGGRRWSGCVWPMAICQRAQSTTAVRVANVELQ